MCNHRRKIIYKQLKKKMDACHKKNRTVSRESEYIPRLIVSEVVFGKFSAKISRKNTGSHRNLKGNARNYAKKFDEN